MKWKLLHLDGNYDICSKVSVWVGLSFTKFHKTQLFSKKKLFDFLKTYLFAFGCIVTYIYSTILNEVLACTFYKSNEALLM